MEGLSSQTTISKNKGGAATHEIPYLILGLFSVTTRVSTSNRSRKPCRAQPHQCSRVLGQKSEALYLKHLIAGTITSEDDRKRIKTLSSLSVILILWVKVPKLSEPVCPFHYLKLNFIFYVGSENLKNPQVLKEINVEFILFIVHTHSIFLSLLSHPCKTYSYFPHQSN